MDSWIFALYFALNSSVTLFYCSNCSSFSHWELFLWAYVPLINPHQCRCVLFFLSTSLLSGSTRCCRLVLYNPCSRTRMNHFSKDPWFLLLKNGIRSWDLSAGCKHYFFHISLSPATLWTLCSQEPYSSLYLSANRGSDRVDVQEVLN